VARLQDFAGVIPPQLKRADLMPTHSRKIHIGDPAMCFGPAARGWRVVAVIFAVAVLLQLTACRQDAGPSVSASLRDHARLTHRALERALLTAGGYMSDPDFRPQRPIVRTLWDISTGKPARVAILISGGPYIDLKGIVAVLKDGNQVVDPLKVDGCIAFLQTMQFNGDNAGPDSVLLLSTDGWWPEENIKRYHLITLANGKLVETFSARGNFSDGMGGDPPVDRFTALAPVSLPMADHFYGLCLFSRWFGARRSMSAKLWRWDPATVRFVPLSKQEIDSINSDVLKWARGVKW
jgi:hypothetical protein